ncbi:putative ATP synthase YscN [Defluviimonas aquaemixtae]|uniref:Putative ATP synthase YscN n=1 Tax=Albidovulum aquaemixtae TaxID=1542388 RepID=A0A2R8BJJ6_9RHOB|nr:FliI/YscN family ATPase [Defluviimonas aquaemixtae]SPH23449.1 putative ATP synthase YscN [Defluviimonas aquaemixtae]
MAALGLEMLRSEIGVCGALTQVGRVHEVGRGLLRVTGTGDRWRLGDRVRLDGGTHLGGEVVALDATCATVLTDGPVDGIRLGDEVELLGAGRIAPDDSWIGRILDAFGQPMDGRPLLRGRNERAFRADPPAPAARRRLGGRLETGVAVFDTFLPLVRGQRIGIFAGSGVGKSSVLARLARGVEADVTVIALIGERGRELREFVESVLGEDGMSRSVVVAATSDQSPLVRRRAAWTAMTVAEHFRDQGLQVLLLADSVTRFAEAHREVALAAGEPPSLRGFPPTTSHLITSLAERAGPGADGAGDITAVFTVLVAGSDMDEPVSDIIRGVLDGHVVMEREIAERGRYPAINLLRSVSRALPQAATTEENALIARARYLLGAYDRAETMIQAGLYVPGSDATIDAAIRVWPTLDAYLAEESPAGGIGASFSRLKQILESAGA